MKDNIKKNKEKKSWLMLGTAKRDNVIFSFVIPTYNRPQTLMTAVYSIIRMELFDETKCEIIIVDNSADFTDVNISCKYIKEMKHRAISYYINECNLGVEGNWNRCAELANGKYICMLHDDDILDKKYLLHIQDCLSYISEISDLGFIKVAHHTFADEDKLPSLSYDAQIPVRETSIMESMIRGCGPTWSPTCGILFYKENFIKCGGFDPELYPSSDSAFGITILNRGYKGFITNNELAYYRIGLNDSMRIETIKNFIIKDTAVRDYIYRSKWYGYIFKFLFEQVQYTKRIDFWTEYSKRYFNMTITKDELDYKEKYKHSLGRELLMKIWAKLFYCFNRH